MFIASLIIAAVSVVIDQLIKLYINSNFGLNEVKKFIPHVLSITHIRNTGAAWSMMAGKTWFLIALPCVVIALAVWYMYRNRHGSKLCLISLGLILGGGIGNLIDRVRMHEVIDYLKCELFNFPIFNFADICVVIGAVLFCVYMFFFDESPKKEKKTEKSDGE
ncbi:signal peptidase II [Ruminococcus sp. YE71]|uniref:signal peptidase II n=1 Tax=unclassified Ruminococcus TaxID=2608920 RepID=UPI00088966FF|nr:MULTISPECIES: signal peptidase II [unclassified Ruminococcus]SDA13635.1 signal peptidase II [Ruminococcus sp. YE78]SFW19410.1 signal peptidase II [Ruminococcus sp. YE71]